MRKIIILGLGALSTLALTVGPSTPAQAVISPPGSITDQVCNAVPAGLVGVVNQLVATSTHAGLVSTDLTNSTTDLGLKTTDLVNALVSHITTVDGGGNTAATSSVVSARASAYADSAAVWTKANKDLNADILTMQVLGMQQGVLTAIGSGLSC